MTPELEEVPPIVARLSEEVNMHPIAWNVGPETITIVFQEGQKIHFDRPGALKSGPQSLTAGPIGIRSKPSLVVDRIPRSRRK
jgi:hypothetical protein